MASPHVRVGLFVLLGLVVSAALIFVVGDERRVFDRKHSLHSQFTEVSGLKPGAPVRMGGVDIGTVELVRFGTDAKDRTVHVQFNVVDSAYGRIREDSKVTVANKGLLGDKMLEVTQGSESRKLIPENGAVESAPAEDFSRYLAKADEILDSAKRTMNNVERFSEMAADPRMREDIQSTVHSIRVILTSVTEHDGFARRLLTDSKLADHLDRLTVDGAHAARSFSQTADEAQATLRQVNAGPGLAHSILFGEDGQRLVQNTEKLTAEFARTMEEVRTGQGMAHDIIYGKEGTQLTRDMTAISADLRQVVADLRAGKGTLGALLVDPSIYEDVKSILGNLERNQVLRALVRYSIKQDESRPPAPMSTPAPAASTSRP